MKKKICVFIFVTLFFLHDVKYANEMKAKQKIKATNLCVREMFFASLAVFDFLKENFLV